MASDADKRDVRLRRNCLFGFRTGASGGNGGGEEGGGGGGVVAFDQRARYR